MKKLTYIISAISILLATSCTNELETTMQEGKLSFSSINASMADLPTSRTHLKGDGKVVWDNGDKIGIFSDMQITPVVFECTNINENNASFVSENKVNGNNFFAYYPYENATINENTMTYTLSNTTEYKKGTYFRQCPMVAKSTTNEFGFKHTCGIIRFSITGTQRIQSLVLEGNNSEIIAGTGTIDLSAETPALIIPADATDAGKTITMTMNNLQLSSTATDFYFIVPQGEFTQGLSLTINYIDEDGSHHYLTRSTSKSINISRSVIKSFTLFNTDEWIEEEEERIYTALMAFYNATNGDNWTNNTNWGSDKPFSEWYGIFAVGNNVKGIDLANNNLVGQLPKEIVDMESLTDIFLYGNKLSGTIPTELANLRKLENIYLSENQLTGELPKKLGDLISLKNLILDNNKLSGSIPVEYGKLKNLETLRLGGNQLTGELPNELGNLASLEYLYLSHTNISGSIPNELVNLSKLKVLSLESNNLEGNIPTGMNKLTVLEDLGLSNNQLTGNIPKDLGQISTLKRLHIGDNQLSGTIPTEIARLLNLEVLSFANNNLTGTLPEDFINLEKLNMLYVDGNMLNGTCSEELSSFIEDLGYYSIVQQTGYELKLHYYYSSDFSKDGTVNVLQTHNKGNGIPIVITGDAFSDRKIADGTFESYINMCYEALFSEEPYKSFKEYFDVYSILTVSKRGKIGTETALNTTTVGDIFALDYDSIKKYLFKVPQLNSNLKNVTAIVILNDGSWWRSNCSWFEYGLSISCANIRSDEEFVQTVHHEVLGHGFGLLGDEYIEMLAEGGDLSDYEQFPEGNRQDIWDLHSDGFYLNVDVTNDKSVIVWKDFLSNKSYQAEGIGIYEGALLYKYGAYRPTNESIMKANAGGFNAPSRWAIYKRIMELAGETYSFDTFLEYDKKNLTTINAVSARSVSEEAFDTRKLGAPPIFLNR